MTIGVFRAECAEYAENTEREYGAKRGRTPEALILILLCALCELCAKSLNIRKEYRL